MSVYNLDHVVSHAYIKENLSVVMGGARFFKFKLYTLWLSRSAERENFGSYLVMKYEPSAKRFSFSQK